jgi:hypothetical protein
VCSDAAEGKDVTVIPGWILQGMKQQSYFYPMQNSPPTLACCWSGAPLEVVSLLDLVEVC